MKTKRLILSLGVAAVVSSVLFAQDNTTDARTTVEITWEDPASGAGTAWMIGYSVFEAEARDVVWAIETLLRYATNEGVMTEDLVYRSPAAELRLMADRLEQKEKDIARARAILEQWKQIEGRW